MSKLYRSLLWSGLVVAGVAACGDNVTPPPPPPLTVRSVSVAPSPVTIGLGATVQMVASVNADAGVLTTVTWSTGQASVATVSAAGLVTGVSVGSVAITACSTVTTSVCGSATVTVSSSAATVASVTVTPPSGNVIKPAGAATGTLQLSAAVSGTNNPSQTVTWTVVSGPVGASISASGLLTITSAITAGVVNVSACSTVSGFTTVCGFSAVSISTPTPATVSISSITWVPAPPGSCVPGPGPAVAVLVTNVRCQIEVTANVNAGDQILGRMDVLIGGLVVASQTFPGTAPAVDGPEAASAPVLLTLSVNTQQLRRPTGSTTLFVPVIFNGNQFITLNLYTATSATPVASNPTPVVMNNPDAALRNGLAFTLVNNSSSPSFSNIVGTWFTGTQTGGSIQYASFSTIAPTVLSFTSSGCGGTSTSNNITGTAATGIVIGANWTCAAFEGGNSVTGVTLPATYPTLVGPDGTTAAPATGFSNVGTGFPLPVAGSLTLTELRWNMINPGVASTASTTVLVDNKPPTVTIGVIAYNASYDQKWVNGSFNLSAAVTLVDGGTGPNNASKVTRFWNPLPVLTPSCTGAAITTSTASSLAETLTSSGFDAYQICGSGADNIGNVAASVNSNFFGVDKTPPLARLAGSTAATPSIAPSNTSTISTTANTTIYVIPAQINSQVFGLEGFDTRSGFNQTVVAGSDAATQTLVRTLASGVTSCSVNDQLTQVLSDSWIRMPTLTFIDCGSGLTGYYDYTGNVNDRAGNFSTTFVRNFAFDLAAPATSFVSPAQTTYTPGLPAAFNIFASDDLEVLQSYLSFSFTGMGPPAAGIIYPYSSVAGLAIGSPWPSSSPISALVPSAGTSGLISVPYLLGRIDESCVAAAVPYPGCSAVVGSKTVAGDYNRDLNLNAPSSGNAAQAPTGIVTNVQDIALRDGLTGAAFSFNPVTFVTPVSQQWAAATDLATWIGKNGTGDCPAGTICADQKTGTSVGLRFFTTVSLWRLDTATNQWNFCGDLAPQGPPPFVDNGVFRIWRSTLATPGGSTTCGALTGFYRVMGTLNGAGLFSPSF